MFDLSKLASIKIGLASPEVIKSWSILEQFVINVALK